MLNQSTTEVEVETEVFKEQARIISELPIDQLIAWFQKGNEGYLLVDSRGAPEFRLSLANQKALLEKSNLEINRLLAWHNFLNLELADALIEINDATIVDWLCFQRPHLSESQLNRMLFLAKDAKTLRAFLRCSQVSRELSVVLLKKADEIGGAALIKEIAEGLIGARRDCELDEFKTLAKLAGYAKNDRHVSASPCLPLEMQNDIVIHGSREDKMYLAQSFSIKEDIKLRLLSFNDPKINDNLLYGGVLPKKVVKGLAKKSTRLDYETLCRLISYHPGVPQADVRRFLKKVKECEEAKVNHSLISKVDHHFMKSIPLNIINECLRGVYGQTAKIAAYSRSEISKEVIQHLNANYFDLTPEEKKSLVYNESIPIEMRSKMSYDETLWQRLQFHKEAKGDETFNFSFVVFASGHMREEYPENPYWAQGRILTPISDMMDDLIKEYGEEFLKIYFGKDISVADVRRAYAALNP